MYIVPKLVWQSEKLNWTEHSIAMSQPDVLTFIGLQIKDNSWTGRANIVLGKIFPV